MIRHADGDFERAEEALSQAFCAALEQWQQTGLPDSPAGWLRRVAERRLIDDARRRSAAQRARDSLRREADETVRETVTDAQRNDGPRDDHAFGRDDRLRLIFTCCHPALKFEARVALTLNTLAGLRAAEIARAFVTSEITLAQRLVRAKRKIRAAKIPYRVPPASELPDRLRSVLRVLYLIFNEGHTASTGDALGRPDLARQALDMTRLLCDLMPQEAEARGLLALILLQDSRRLARVDPSGDLVLLAEQDRSLWNRETIDEGLACIRTALGEGRPGPYQIQAAIAALHAEAEDAAATDWPQIRKLYDALLRLDPSPVIALNRAVAVSMVEGVEPALAETERLVADGRLERYVYLHSTRADFLRRLGRVAEARASYRHALELAGNASERRFLSTRLAELDDSR